MKEVTLDGYTFQYDAQGNGHGKTLFYCGEKFAFSVSGDVNNPSLSRHFWLDEIRKGIKIWERKLEIERGELI